MKNENATDWDSYYETVPVTAKVTRRITTHLLISLLQRHGITNSQSFIELGGANSCFFTVFNNTFKPSSYVIVDTNEKGLEKFRRANGEVRNASCVLCDVLDIDKSGVDLADLVFSVGLVEHFDEKGTRAAIRSHFELAKPGGLILITFPTPTLIYRIARGLLEKIGQWKFPDERPLRFDEVRAAISSEGKILQEYVSNAIVLSQGIIVAKKH